MDKLTRKKALLDKIRAAEGNQFKCDENAIIDAYNHQLENKSNLAIKILSIFGGFLATLAFLGFLGLLGLYNSDYALLCIGVIFISTAIGLNKIYNKLIIDTLSISTYVIGFSLFVFALSMLDVNENIIAILICFISGLSLIITQNFLLSFISTLVISACFIFLITSNEFYDLIHAYIAINALLLTYVFLYEAKIISISKKLNRLYYPLRIGLVFALLLGLIYIGKRNLVPIDQNLIWLSSIAIILITLFLASRIIAINKLYSVKKKLMVYILTILVLSPTILSPSISGAILIILLSFLVNYKTGFVIGIISIIYFISQYYYDLNFTLLTKSIILFVSGIMFLLFYFFTNRKIIKK